MTFRDRAKKLVDKFFWKSCRTKEQAKECALICVDEIIDYNYETMNSEDYHNALNNLQILKEEIQNL